ncbi:MAG: inositol monophosphatase family protein [Chromatiales bacterium]
MCSLLRRLSERVLVPGFSRARGRTKPDGSLVTDADLAMQAAVARELEARWPDVPVLGEEMPAAEQRRLLAGGDAALWCLDPLDGTSNYASGVPFFAVSLALIRAGRVELGVVYDPLRGECFSAARGRGAWLDDRGLRLLTGGLPLRECVALVDFKRLPPRLAERLAVRPPFRSQRSFGAVALDWCWLAAGRGHLYLHGGQKLWDYAAGRLILAEAGGTSRCCDRLGGTCDDTAVLEPRVAVAAVDRGLFGAWEAELLRAG